MYFDSKIKFFFEFDKELHSPVVGRGLILKKFKNKFTIFN